VGSESRRRASMCTPTRHSTCQPAQCAGMCAVNACVVVYAPLSRKNRTMSTDPCWITRAMIFAAMCVCACVVRAC